MLKPLEPLPAQRLAQQARVRFCGDFDRTRKIIVGIITGLLEGLGSKLADSAPPNKSHPAQAARLGREQPEQQAQLGTGSTASASPRTDFTQSLPGLPWSFPAGPFLGRGGGGRGRGEAKRWYICRSWCSQRRDAKTRRCKHQFAQCPARANWKGDYRPKLRRC